VTVEFAKKYGPWALIAGGSEGIGACFARRLAGNGINLILTARKPEPLETLAEQIRVSQPNCAVRIFPGDLCDPGYRTKLQAFTQDVEVNLLIYNAGAASRTGYFCDDDVDFAQHLVALNVTAKIDLTHYFGGLMKARGRGGIVLIGSMAGLVGTPGIAVYSGVKAFSVSFAEALWGELKPHGVDVLGFLLGPTNTPAMARHYPDRAAAGADPDEVARQGLGFISDGPIHYAGDNAAVAAALSKMTRAEAVSARAAQAAAYLATSIRPRQ
jgi:short-subunit dehydrogenase